MALHSRALAAGVSGSASHCLALTSGGDIFAWGDAAGGALGLEQLGSLPSPPRRRPVVEQESNTRE